MGLGQPYPCSWIISFVASFQNLQPFNSWLLVVKFCSRGYKFVSQSNSQVASKMQSATQRGVFDAMFIICRGTYKASVTKRFNGKCSRIEILLVFLEQSGSVHCHHEQHKRQHAPIPPPYAIRTIGALPIRFLGRSGGSSQLV